MDNIWVVIITVLWGVLYILCGVTAAVIHEVILRMVRSDSFTHSWLYCFWNALLTHHRNWFNRLHVAFSPVIMVIGLLWFVGVLPFKSLYRFLNPEKYSTKRPTPVAEVTQIDTKKKRRRTKRAS